MQTAESTSEISSHYHARKKKFQCVTGDLIRQISDLASVTRLELKKGCSCIPIRINNLEIYWPASISVSKFLIVIGFVCACSKKKLSVHMYLWIYSVQLEKKQ